MQKKILANLIEVNGREVSKAKTFLWKIWLFFWLLPLQTQFEKLGGPKTFLLWQLCFQVAGRISALIEGSCGRKRVFVTERNFVKV